MGSTITAPPNNKRMDEIFFNGMLFDTAINSVTKTKNVHIYSL